MTNLMIAIIQALLGNQSLRDFIIVHSRAYVETLTDLNPNNEPDFVYCFNSGVIDDIIEHIRNNPKTLIFWVASTGVLNLNAAVEYAVQNHRNHSRANVFRRIAADCKGAIVASKGTYNVDITIDDDDWRTPSQILEMEFNFFLLFAEWMYSDSNCHVNHQKLCDELAKYDKDK